MGTTFHLSFDIRGAHMHIPMHSSQILNAGGLLSVVRYNLRANQGRRKKCRRLHPGIAQCIGQRNDQEKIVEHTAVQL